MMTVGRGEDEGGDQVVTADSEWRQCLILLQMTKDICVLDATDLCTK